MNPPVTVLVPAFNDAAYLEAALSSVAAQSHRELEVLIADDASSDDTPRIAEAFAARDRRFRLSRLETNVGMNRNWNRALAEARGDLVLKLDADDAMTPGCVEALRGELAGAPEVLFAACRTLDCDEALRPLAPFPGERALRSHGVDPERRHLRRGLEWLRCCFEDAQLWHSDAQMYRRAELIALGGWDERWFSSDTELILRALATDRPVVHRPEVGILYRRRPGSGSDRERSSGALDYAGTMILLRSLHEQARRLALDSRLRQSWWRLWQRFAHARRRRAGTFAAAGEDGARLAALAEETARLAPPLRVRLEGRVRYWAWRARRRTRALGGSAEPGVGA